MTGEKIFEKTNWQFFFTRTAGPCVLTRAKRVSNQKKAATEQRSIRKEQKKSTIFSCLFFPLYSILFFFKFLLENFTFFDHFSLHFITAANPHIFISRDFLTRKLLATLIGVANNFVWGVGPNQAACKLYELYIYIYMHIYHYIYIYIYIGGAGAPHPLESMYAIIHIERAWQ